jgi:hypothetical protein
MPEKPKKRLARVPIVLADDRERFLYYTLDDVYEMTKAKAGANESSDPRVFVKTVWLGLRHDEPDLTIEQVMQLVDAVNLDYYIACVNEASNPTQAAAAQLVNGAALPSTGNNYAPLPATASESVKTNSGN